VSTDVFGRGIDIERINLAINYDMPSEADSYLHRVGRAGRFGTKGLAISFVTTEQDKEVLKNIEKRFEVALPYVHSCIKICGSRLANYYVGSSRRRVLTPRPTWLLKLSRSLGCGWQFLLFSCCDERENVANLGEWCDRAGLLKRLEILLKKQGFSFCPF
jgi:hypothetical protein